MDPTKFGFFEYRPRELLDLDLVDAVLEAAQDEVGVVDIVALPEAAILPEDIEPLERVLAARGVWSVIAGGPDDATDEEWRRTLNLPSPKRLFTSTIAALRRELPAVPDLAAVSGAAERLHASTQPADIIAGTVLLTALEQRVLTENTAGRLTAQG